MPEDEINRVQFLSSHPVKNSSAYAEYRFIAAA